MNTRTALTCVAIFAVGMAACSTDSETSDTTSSSSQSSEVTVDATDTTTDVTTDATTDDTTSITGDIDERLDAAESALEDGDFTLMLEVLELSGLADEIRDEQLTILAPNDEAFGELDGAEYAELLTNPTEIDDLLKGHVIEELLTYDDLAALTEVTTMGGQTLEVTFVDGVLTVGGATVLEPVDSAVSGEDGQEVVVLEIDRVLLDDAS